MANETPVKALVVTVADDAAAAAYSVNRLKPDALCFVLTEQAKTFVETEVQPNIEQMPRRWDWIVLSNTSRFPDCYRTLAKALPDLLRTWDVQPGELVVDLTGAAPATAAAVALAASPFCSRTVALVAGPGGGDETVSIGERTYEWVQGNPWDETAVLSGREAAELFNRGMPAAAAVMFRQLEVRVSGGQKPLYRAFADLAEGYDLWDRLHYRQAWDKLKSAAKALDMASLWGGPPGLKTLLPAVKANAAFLEKLVLDPAEVKESVALDLLAQAHRLSTVHHDPEQAMTALVRALEAAAQHRLFKHHRIKTWDVDPEQLPQALRETCRTCHLNDLDGKYMLPLQSQFQALAGLGDEMGQAFLRDWPKMKPLLDAANHAVLGHGFEPVKAERVQQLYEIALRVTGASEAALPRFPTLNL